MAPLGHPKKPIVQLGHAWLVSLIVLSAAATLCFVAFVPSGSRSSPTGVDDRGKAFEAAERALVQLEESLRQNPPAKSDFSETCMAGLCISNSYTYSIPNQRCLPKVGGANFLTDMHPDIWSASEKHEILSFTEFEYPIKYFVHLLCPVGNSMLYQLELTVLAEGADVGSSVALQSRIDLVLE